MSSKRGAGRPTKLTQEIHDTIIKNVRMGVTFVDAAGAVGVDYTTLAGWMRRGETETKGIYFNFFNAITQARSEALQLMTKVITKAGVDGDWRASLEYLKRHSPQVWGDRVSIDIDLTKLTDEQLALVAAGEDISKVAKEK